MALIAAVWDLGLRVYFGTQYPAAEQNDDRTVGSNSFRDERTR